MFIRHRPAAALSLTLVPFLPSSVARAEAGLGVADGGGVVIRVVPALTRARGIRTPSDCPVRGRGVQEGGVPRVGETPVRRPSGRGASWLPEDRRQARVREN
ncbi:hypothetical protein GCM10027075_13800 [Streptomyces heilongjiangensis]